MIIVGASGFIGKNLLERIANANGLSLRQQNWKEILGKEDIVLNLVGKAHDHKGTVSKKEFYFVNLELLKDLYTAFLQSTELKLFIHLSSLASIEEVEANSPLSENYVGNPISYYGQSKREAEKWLLAQELPENKTLIILRPPMVHGPGDKGNLGLLYKFISRGFPYPLSAFDNKRSFISINNLCFFINKIIDNYHRMESGVYHVADDEAVSTKEIIQIIQKVNGRKTYYVFFPKSIVVLLAKLGDFFSFPFNSLKLKKMTSNLLVSNKKIKDSLGINKLPESALQGLENTIRLISKSNSR